MCAALPFAAPLGPHGHHRGKPSLTSDDIVNRACMSLIDGAPVSRYH